MTSNLGMAIPWNIALEESKNGNLTFPNSGINRVAMVKNAFLPMSL